MAKDFQLAWPYDLPEMGVYQITCAASGQVYVGQSRRIRGRWRDHVKELRAGRGCPRLQKAWDLYGGDSFTFRILEEVPDPDQLAVREQHYMDACDACGQKGMNTLPTAGSFKGYTPNAEARAKIGDATRRRLVADPTFQPKMVKAALDSGYVPTQRHRERVAEAQRGVPKGSMSAAHKQAISDAKKGQPPWPRLQRGRVRPKAPRRNARLGRPIVGDVGQRNSVKR